MYKVCLDVWETLEREVQGVFRCLGDMRERYNVFFDVWETLERDVQGVF